MFLLYVKQRSFQSERSLPQKRWLGKAISGTTNPSSLPLSNTTPVFVRRERENVRDMNLGNGVRTRFGMMG